MKKILLLASFALAITACDKKETTTPAETQAVTADQTAPVLAMQGSTNDTMSLNSTYSDPGATANDNVDGNISSHVLVSGTINKDLVGEYRLYYNVKDAAGNSAAQLTRYVYVKNDADFLKGIYNATPNCGASSTSTGTWVVSTSNTVNNRVNIGIPNNVAAFSPEINVNGSAIIIPFQTSGSGSGSSFVGNGSIASNKLSFSLSYTAASNTSVYGTWNCSTNFVKQ